MSDASDVVETKSSEAAPSGKPQNVTVKPISQTSLLATWNAPIHSEWNGEILGFYVGYKETSSSGPYYFETVEEVGEEGKEYSKLLKNLKKYTHYSVTVQAYNRVGAGPRSDVQMQYTEEGTPEQPPSDLSCTTLTSHRIQASWTNPPPESINGILKNYKVIYSSSDVKNGNDREITMNGTDLILDRLKAYTNYIIQVLATTSNGDGVRSKPIQCQTDQDGKYVKI